LWTTDTEADTQATRTDAVDALVEVRRHAG
jgi:hypothetical protein